MWAMELRGVTPIARLVALFIADKFRPLSDWPASGEYDDDPELISEVRRAAEWIGCSEYDVIAGTNELVAHGVRITAIANGIIWFRFPTEPPRTSAEPRSAKEREISIYVISAGEASKIGISVDPISRAASLQGANPLMRLTLQFHARGPSSKIRKIERDAHFLLAQHAIGNEWFSVDHSEAEQIVKALLRDVGL